MRHRGIPTTSPARTLDDLAAVVNEQMLRSAVRRAFGLRRVGIRHDNPVARADDAERQALLKAAGERVVRVTWAQAVGQPAQTIARLRAAVRG
jgi:hypothetical protein